MSIFDWGKEEPGSCTADMMGKMEAGVVMSAARPFSSGLGGEGVLVLL